MTSKKQIVLDCDPGEDDALAILYTLVKGYNLRALVCGFGNTSPQNTIYNGMGLLSLAERADVPIFKGTYEPYKPHPLEEKPVDAGNFVGTNGLCGIDLPAAPGITPVNSGMEKDALLQTLCNHVRTSGPLTYIITGPCGTLAHVLDLLGDDAAGIIGHIILMGGALDATGNHGPINPGTGKSYAEFNFYCDPFGTQRVLESGLPVTIVPWDLTERIVIGYSDLTNLRGEGPIGPFVLTLMKNFLESYGIENNRPFEFNDCITLTAYEGKGIFRDEKIRVITEGEQAGRIVRDDSENTVRFFDLPEKDIISVRDEILKTLGIE